MRAPIENLAAQLGRNEYNYNSILRGLVEWDMNKGESTTIRLMIDREPYFVDYDLPSKDTITDYTSNTTKNVIQSAVIDDTIISHSSLYLKDDEVIFNLLFEGAVPTSIQIMGLSALDSSPVFLSEEFTPTSYASIPGLMPIDIKTIYVVTKTSIASPSTITLMTRLVERTVNTPYYKSTGIYHEVNYSNWPYETNPVWSSTSSLSANTTTAKMTLSHINPDTNTINFINYTGPDANGGLKIYLPVYDYGISPRDGFTFEFNIRVAPNSLYGLQDELLRRQVHIYSVTNPGDFSESNPLVKLSHARMNNFYTWGENITVPNSAVYYYVKVVYSQTTRKWELLSFNQLDDHVFFGQVGFVDPVEMQTNPNAPYYKAMETSDIPTFASPFKTETMESQPLREVIRNPFN